MSSARGRQKLMSLPFLVCVWLASPAAFGDTLVVDDTGGPGVDHTDLVFAIDAAVDGDTILVRSGNYGGFNSIGKALVVTAERDAVVNVQGTIVIQNVDATRSFVLRGVDVRPDHPSAALGILNCVGPVWVEDCSLVGFDVMTLADHVERTAVDAFRSNQVVIERCELVGGRGHADNNPFGGSGLMLSGSQAWVHDSIVRAGKSELAANLVGFSHAGAVVSGTLVASGSTFVGGEGGDGVLDAAGCTDGGEGGAGIALLGHISMVRVSGSTVIGGRGGVAAAPCAAGSDGAKAFEQGAFLFEDPEPPSSLRVVGPLRTDELLELNVSGEGGDLVFLILASDTAPFFLQTTSIGPFPIQPGVVLPALGAHALVFAGSIPVGGAVDPPDLTWSAQVADLGAFPGLTVYAQALSFRAGAGGRFVLSGGQAVPIVP